MNSERIFFFCVGHFIHMHAHTNISVVVI